MREGQPNAAARALTEYLGVARQLDTLWFAIFYSITFGGFVGLASVLAIFFNDHYGVSKVAAGDLTAICVFAGSFMRPLGGWLADRHGGIRMLQVLYGLVALLLVAIAALPALTLAVPLFVVTLALLGAGNGAVFQLVPLRFQRDVGLITGLVGAAGGLGGFFLPSVLGLLRDATGTWSGGFPALAAVCLWGMSLIFAVKGAWQLTGHASRAPARLARGRRASRRDAERRHHARSWCRCSRRSSPRMVEARPARAAFPETAPLSVAGPDGSSLTLSASDRLRGEFADWFDAGGAAANSDYGYLGNRTQVGLLAKWRGLSGFLQYQHTVLDGVPQHAAGIGGTYRANTNSDFQEGGWLRQGWLQGEGTQGDWRFTAQGGRLRYQDGMESVSKQPLLEWIGKNRIAERLVGPFDYTHIGRSFDGGRVTFERTRAAPLRLLLLPTSAGSRSAPAATWASTSAASRS